MQSHNDRIIDKDIPIGLKNHGNTCFVNATLQSLANCDSLFDLFQREYLRVHNVALSSQIPTPVMGCKKCLHESCLLCLLEKTFLTIRSPHDNGSAGSHFLKQVIDSFPQFPMHLFTKGRQEDCHEFLINILFAFQLYQEEEKGEIEDTSGTAISSNEVNTSSKISRMPSQRTLSAPTPSNINDPFLHHPDLEQLFQGKVQQDIICKRCSSSSTRQESMIDLAVDIQASSTLETSIQEYFQ